MRDNLGNPVLKEIERKALSDFILFSSIEESLLRQKSRNKWIAKGDNNSVYFHNCVKDRINRNEILSLTRANNLGLTRFTRKLLTSSASSKMMWVNLIWRIMTLVLWGAKFLILPKILSLSREFPGRRSRKSCLV